MQMCVCARVCASVYVSCRNGEIRFIKKDVGEEDEASGQVMEGFPPVHVAWAEYCWRLMQRANAWWITTGAQSVWLVSHARPTQQGTSV
jgi:hypothetical protein